MNRRLIQILFVSVLLVLLAGCGKNVEEQAQLGVASAKTTFSSAPLEANTELKQISLYLPKDFTISEDAVEMNYSISDGKLNYILFVNTIEDESSKLHYELLMEDTTKQFVREETFEQDGEFGFCAVVQFAEQQYELIVGIGGRKLTVISEGKKIDETLARMMEIVQSVQAKK